MNFVMLVVVGTAWLAIIHPGAALRAIRPSGFRKTGLVVSNQKNTHLSSLSLSFKNQKRADEDDTSLDSFSESMSPRRDQDTPFFSNLVTFYRDYVRKNKVSGFTDLSETINGRLAMIGLTVGFVQEFFTGQTLLQQIGVGSSKLWPVEITEEYLGISIVAFFVVTISIFNSRPPRANEIR